MSNNNNTKNTQNKSFLIYARCIILFLIICAQATKATATMPVKDWTVIVYMAADNDLKGFAAQNIKQMAEIGSNQYLNIVVELHIRISGNQKVTRRYFIEQNKIFHVNADDPWSQKMDSGNPDTLVSCCQWATTDYPANKYALILWNHGTGPLDPSMGRIINPTELFTYNATINKFELDRTTGFLEFVDLYNKIDRGVCWDDSTGNYLTNQKLEAALKKIKNSCLNNNKLNIIGFDACLMATIEIANLAKDYANILVGSQEVELGTGLNYQRTLNIFQYGTTDEKSFAQNIVKEFGKTYQPITNDYTHSAMDLSKIVQLETNINNVANLLMLCLDKQKNMSVYNAIRASQDRRVCTHFDEPTYKDLHHLYKNLQANLVNFSLTDKTEEITLKTQLNQAFDEGCALIKTIAFANISGTNLKLAQGISIYLPETRIHPSYPKTKFAATNQWIMFLNHYLS